MPKRIIVKYYFTLMAAYMQYARFMIYRIKIQTFNNPFNDVSAKILNAFAKHNKYAHVACAYYCFAVYGKLRLFRYSRQMRVLTRYFRHSNFKTPSFRLGRSRFVCRRG